MIRINFTPGEIKALAYERYHHPHPIVQRKMEVLYLKSQGLSYKEIARLAGVTLHTVTRHLKEYQDGGMERLQEINIYRPHSALEAHRTSLEAYARIPPHPLKRRPTRSNGSPALPRGDVGACVSPVDRR